MRVKNSIKNMLSAVFVSILSMAIGLFSQAVFLKALSSEYLGLNSLFSNVISMLSIAELGLGTSIVYCLYKPIATGDKEKIKSLMKFYKNGYRLIGLSIFVLGIAIIPVLPFFIKKSSIEINVNFAYFLALMSTVLSYFLSYKRSILYASQKNYLIKLVHIGYLVVFNFVQIAFLLMTKNYYIYLIIKIVMNIIENLVITIIANKMYSFLKEKNIEPLNKEEKNNIYIRIKAMFFHKIGSFVVLGTDNLLISKFLGLATLGLYSNYYIVINAIKRIVFQIIESTTASVGNLIALDSKEKQFNIFKKIRFANFWLATFTCASILLIIESFISIWIGKQYILSKLVLVVLVINLYFNETKATFYAFKDAAGIYYEDRFVPIFESITNIVASILFIKLIGLSGVFLGTIVSSFLLCFYSYPKYVYKKLFDRGYKNYFMETFGYIFIFFFITTITYVISNIIILDNVYIEFLKNCVIALIVPNLMMILFFYRTSNFKYFLSMFKKRSTNKNLNV